MTHSTIKRSENGVKALQLSQVVSQLRERQHVTHAVSWVVLHLKV